MKRRHGPPERTVEEKRKDREWGETKSEMRRENRQKVYEVILSLRRATTRQIGDMLQKRKVPLSLRTIERCIKGGSPDNKK